ncbi:MAG TPA: chemotaxis protein CheW [Candidatus Tectomicrobia bacterium]|jgi:purine-binding chemotaxis protein CheW
MVLSQQSSVLQLVPFIIEEQQYALPLAIVERVLPMVAVSPLPQAPCIALGVINLHGRVIPVLDIRRRLGLPARGYGLTTYLLVARTSRRTCALPVDEVWGVRQVAAAAVVPADAVLPHLGHVAGIVVLADGLLVIQDLEAFLSLEEEQQLVEALKGTET